MFKSIIRSPTLMTLKITSVCKLYSAAMFSCSNHRVVIFVKFQIKVQRKKASCWRAGCRRRQICCVFSADGLCAAWRDKSLCTHAPYITLRLCVWMCLSTCVACLTEGFFLAVMSVCVQLHALYPQRCTNSSSGSSRSQAAERKRISERFPARYLKWEPCGTCLAFSSAH